MFVVSTITSFLLLVASASNCAASPMNSQSDVVFNPHITYPKAGMTWLPGSTHNVTWDTADIPYQRRGATGLILLGYSEEDDEHLDIHHPLASSFPIETGHIQVTLPKTTKARDDYFLVLFGDSGNKSQKFKVPTP